MKRLTLLLLKTRKELSLIDYNTKYFQFHLFSLSKHNYV